jgi:Coenzyme PQQ synthesis protein D (PqqD)
MSPTRVEPSDDVIFQALKGELILLNLKSQQYFGLDDVGSDMWKLLVEYGDVETVADRLSAEYAVDRATAREDLGVLIGRLMDAGLLKAAQTSEQISHG